MQPSSPWPLPNAELVNAAWSSTPDGVFPTRPDKAKAVSGAMMALGTALLLFVPLGGALLVAAGGLGFIISSETPLGGPDR